ncbi:unnamed protein product [Mytilus coruscus]|uniref:C-type lectin domain-containing protein n=1 Tax=Mytilus coruscus TaxID=42192 RepID=A0A6J8E9N9_MYTCO|nr:unnamed protein product [Mytilus coruscus]
MNLEVSVMKENYHTLLQRVIENEQEISALKDKKQQLEHELEISRRSLSCEIESLRNVTIQNEHELNETIHSCATFNETIQDLSQSVSKLNDKFLHLDPAEDTTDCHSGWIRSDDFGTEFWIGGKRQGDVYKWVTSDDKIKDMNYTRWARGSPNVFGSYCVEIDKRFQYKWNDTACVLSQQNICKQYMT